MKLKIESLQRLFIFFLIFFSSASSVIAQNDFLLVLCFLLAIFFNFYLGVTAKFVRSFFFVFLFILLIIFSYWYINKDAEFYTWFGFGIRILFAFVIVNINKSKFIFNFFKVVQYLSVICLFGYLFQLLIPNILINVGNILNIGLFEGDKKIATFFVFNFSNLHSLRNSGCMWEPGAYGALLIIGLLFSYNPPSSIYFNNRMRIPLVISILTTFSTTTYLALFLLFFYIFFTNTINVYKKIFNLIIFLPFILFLFIETEFLSTKISSQYNNIQSELFFSEHHDKNRVSRFTSMVMDYPVFIKRPFLGYGLDLKTINANILYRQYDENIARTYGGFTMLLYFGIIGFLFYFGYLLFNFKILSSSTNYSIFSIIIILMILYSNPLPFSPILFSLFFIHKETGLKNI